VHPLNALEENFERLSRGKKAHRAARNASTTLILLHIEQEDHSSPWKLISKILSSFEAG